MSVAASTEREVASNTVWLMAGRLAVAIVAWVGAILVARHLDSVEFGQFTLVFSVLGMLSIVTDLGIGRVVIAALQRRDADSGRYAGNYIMLRVALGVFGYLLALVFVVVAGYPTVVVEATAIAGVVVLFATPSNAYNVAFQVAGRLAPTAVARVVGQLGQLALTIAVVLQDGSLLWFMLPAVLNEGVVLPWKVPAAHRLVDFHYKLDLRLWRELLREAIPLSAGAAFVTIYYRLDSLMLAEFDTFESVGTYGVGYKFVGLVHFLPSALAVSLVAPLTAAWRADDDQFGRLFENAFRVLLLGAGAALVVFWPFADELAALLYGERYRDAGDPTRLLVSAEALTFFASLTITTLIAVGRYRTYPKITFVGLVINIVLNLVLVPTMSITGAALATLATEAIVVSLLWRECRSLPIDHRLLTRTAVRFIPVVVTSTAAAALVATVAPWPIGAAVGVATFTAAAHAFSIASLQSTLASLTGRSS